MRIQLWRTTAMMFVIACGLSLPRGVQGQDDAAVIASWEGILSVPQGPQLTVVFNVARAPGGGLTGTMDSPDQGAFGIPISSVAFAAGTLTLAAESVPGVPTFTGTLSGDGSMITGTFSQGGGELPLELKKRE